MIRDLRGMRSGHYGYGIGHLELNIGHWGLCIGIVE